MGWKEIVAEGGAKLQGLYSSTSCGQQLPIFSLHSSDWKNPNAGVPSCRGVPSHATVSLLFSSTGITFKAGRNKRAPTPRDRLSRRTWLHKAASSAKGLYPRVAGGRSFDGCVSGHEALVGVDLFAFSTEASNSSPPSVSMATEKNTPASLSRYASWTSAQGRAGQRLHLRPAV